MKFIDLGTQNKLIAKNLYQHLQHIFDHGQYILGPEVKTLEERLATYAGVKHCVAVANGTDALLIAMISLGVKSGDEVITTPFTFIAPAEMALLLGAKVVFVDIDPETYNLDPELLETAITPKTKAIIPVSLFGQCADFDAINIIAAKYNIPVIEDAAQSFGATYKQQRSCSLSTISCTSFFPSKPLGCYGDGGACFTNDEQLAKTMRLIANHGQKRRYDHSLLGLNSRLDTIQAAVLLAKLEIFDDELYLRQKIAAKYHELLNEKIKIPYVTPHNTSVFAQYTIAHEKRDHLQKVLANHKIPTAIHYPVPLHKQKLFANTHRDLYFPNAERAANQVISLPFSAYLKESEVEIVANVLIKELKGE